MYSQGEQLDAIQQGDVSYVLDYVKANGLYVSERWRIGEEAEYGSDLIIRDVISTANGTDAYYDFPVGVAMVI